MTASVEPGDVVAIIPARGGSKGVPGKNVAKVGGVPLVVRAIRAAQQAGIAAVFVSTDDAAIAAVARAAGAGVIDRPAELSGDTASSESALLHALDELRTTGHEPSILAFLQATSPFIDGEALARAVQRVRQGDADSVFSAVETYAFLWRNTPDGAAGVNHDHAHRPRRQDREPHYQETGAFYVMAVPGFRERSFRFFGRVEVELVSAATAIEIDDHTELAIAQRVAPLVDAVHDMIPARALVMDFDGVHTDDLVTVDQHGTESVRVSRSDGMGIGMLRAAGLPMLILSKERNPVVTARGQKLGVDVAQGIDEKLPVLQRWAADLGINLADVAYVGNDINDVPCLAAVGWPIVPADAHPEALGLARVQLRARGGRGALRELADRILAASERNVRSDD